MIVKELDPFSSNDKFEKSGRDAEESVAFYLRRFYQNDPSIHVLNGIRFKEDDDDAAQIDHLIIHASGMIVIECKSVHGKIKLEEDGQWVRWYGKESYGMGSPIKQAELQVEFLRKYLNKRSTNDNQFFDHVPIEILVAISNNGQFLKPKSNPKAAPEVIKMDQIKEHIEKIKNNNPNEILSEKNILKICEFIIQKHTPIIKISEPLKVKEVTAKYEVIKEKIYELEITEKPENKTLNIKNKEEKKKLICESCNIPVTYNVAKFCWTNEKRFNNKTLCMDCQKTINGTQ